MRLLVGLGNPGKKYQYNRHNIGFLTVDAIAEAFASTPWAGKFKGEICEIRLSGIDEKIYLLKPQTYMNLSGESVAAAARFYKIAPQDIIVFYDDIDLADGKIRVRQAGGNGGHNGIKSIDAHMGKDYHRVRIGVDRPVGQIDVADYVLANFTKEEFEIQENIIAAITKNLAILLTQDAAKFMNKISLEAKKTIN